MKRTSIIAVCLLLIGLAVSVNLWWPYIDEYFVPTKPYQEFADELEAQYGWEVIDIAVDEVERVVRIAVIPPEDPEQYIAGFFRILEWAGPYVKSPVEGIDPGALILGELTEDGSYALLLNGTAKRVYGVMRMMGIRGDMVVAWSGEDEDDVPHREKFTHPAEIHRALQEMRAYGLGYLEEWLYGPMPYQPLPFGWYEDQMTESEE